MKRSKLFNKAVTIEDGMATAQDVLTVQLEYLIIYWVKNWLDYSRGSVGHPG